VIQQNIFSYNWVSEGIKNQAKENEDENSLDGDDRSLASSVEESDSVSLPSLTSKASSYRNQRAESINRRKIKKEKIKLHNVSESEEQFFDVIRMRITEVRSAEKRVLSLARMLWTSPVLRMEDNPMHNLTNITVLNGICKWYFNSICRRLVGVPVTEKRGFEMMEQSKGLKLRGEIQWRRANGLNSMITQARSAKHPWDGKPILGPNERRLKKAFIVKLEAMEADSIKYFNEADDLMLEAEKLFKEGRALLPQLQLSRFVCLNYRRKLAASKTKSSLLSVMSIEQMKETLTGSNARDISLSLDSLDRIKEAILCKEVVKAKPLSLDETVNSIISEEINKLNLNESASSGKSSRKSSRKLLIIDSPSVIVRRGNNVNQYPPKIKFTKKNNNNTVLAEQSLSLMSSKEEYGYSPTLSTSTSFPSLR
jgi:hypothetical protein